MKLKTLFTMDWNWAYNYYRNKLYRWYYYRLARLGGVSYYSVQGIKLGFNSAYHHMVAEDMAADWNELPILDLWLARCKGKRLIYDIGAFNGIYGLLAAKENPDARVAFFEPDPTNAAHCRENIRLNNLHNCYLYQVALSDKNGSAVFDADGTTGAKLRPGKHARMVKTRRLDDYPTPDVLKIDVEGHEDAVIRGAAETLKKHPILFLEQHRSIKDPKEMHRNLSDMTLTDLFGDVTSEHHLVYI